MDGQNKMSLLFICEKEIEEVRKHLSNYSNFSRIEYDVNLLLKQLILFLENKKQFFDINPYEDEFTILQKYYKYLFHDKTHSLFESLAIFITDDNNTVEDFYYSLAHSVIDDYILNCAATNDPKKLGILMKIHYEITK